jgi:protein-tyrosine phosphatase/Fe-S-cluster containining protein
MAAYEPSWITENLAVGHAPMSYEELDCIRSQGITAIINLCAEFCDLQEIETTQGFEVYYLPICDDEAPCITDLEPALDWLDEAIYLGKKVLVHCRQGIGRTGTFVTSYLIRKGFSYKEARRRIESTRAGFTSFPQWRLLKKYDKKAGGLSIREPSLETRKAVDLRPFFSDYEQVLSQVDEAFSQAAATDSELLGCGLESDECCFRFIDLHLIEAAYLSNSMNRSLSRDERKLAIQRGVAVSKRMEQLERAMKTEQPASNDNHSKLGELYAGEHIRCPLNVDSKCIVYAARPVGCRIYGLPVSHSGDIEIYGMNQEMAGRLGPRLDLDHIEVILVRMSRNILHALTSSFPADKEPKFMLASTVSGKFVQEYFDHIAAWNSNHKVHRDHRGNPYG